MAEKYTNGSWASTPYRKYSTDTDNITTFPKTIIGDGTAVSAYTVKGDMVQDSGTTTYPVISVTVQALESGTNYAIFNLADFPDVVVGDKITVNVGGTNYTLAVKKVDSTYVYIENREV